MRDYRVHFSFYSEESGNFDDANYTVQAENPFEARYKAWLLCDKDEDTKFRSDIKLFSVTWEPNPCNMEDYFNSCAADIKLHIGRIENVSMPNDRINNDERTAEIDRDKSYYMGCLRTTDSIAQDLYGSKGMTPPSVYEELHYAEKLCEQLGYGDKADALWERIDRAKKWDYGAVYSIRDLFKHGYTILCGETEFFNDNFGKDGIYPAYANLDDRDYSYINRWRNTHKVDTLRKLPMLQESAVILNSKGYMNFEYQILVMDKNHFKDEYQTPENMLWQATHGNGCNPNAKGRSVWADNIITGEHAAFYRQDFLGVIRPDVAANINFEALKNEYAQTYGDKNQEQNISDEQDGFENEDDLEDDDEMEM